jgi:hypothetical protein
MPSLGIPISQWYWRVALQRLLMSWLEIVCSWYNALNSPFSSETIQVLRDFLSYAGIEAEIHPDETYNSWIVAYKSCYPEDIHRTLSAIVTLTADEEFPKLKSLREKVEEVIAIIPEPNFEEDIALVDSPGVHSITETQGK